MAQVKITFSIIIMLVGFSSCKHNVSDKTTTISNHLYLVSNQSPKDLNEAIKYFENNWTATKKEEFIKDSLKNTHFSDGVWIRNNWIYNNRDSSLVKFFNNLDIHHPDDISAIILTSLYRKLNNKPIDLKGQIEKYKTYWKLIFECEAREIKLAKNNFRRLKIGNQVAISLEIDNSDGVETVISRMCPKTEWIFDPLNDLKLIGIITAKYYINNKDNLFIKIKIVKMNKKNVSGIINAKKSGEIIELPMSYINKFEILK